MPWLGIEGAASQVMVHLVALTPTPGPLPLGSYVPQRTNGTAIEPLLEVVAQNTLKFSVLLVVAGTGHELAARVFFFPEDQTRAVLMEIEVVLDKGRQFDLESDCPPGRITE